jgi:hypothetical protein
MRFLTQNKAKVFKTVIITLVFEKSANFFRQKMSKIAENYDHNIDPWSIFFLKDTFHFQSPRRWRH